MGQKGFWNGQKWWEKLNHKKLMLKWTKGNLYLFEPITNPIVGMPILPKTKDSGSAPATPVLFSFRTAIFTLNEIGDAQDNY